MNQYRNYSRLHSVLWYNFVMNRGWQERHLQMIADMLATSDEIRRSS